jgi:hypothetical protein
MPIRVTYSSRGHVHDFNLEPVQRALNFASSTWTDTVAGTGAVTRDSTNAAGFGISLTTGATAASTALSQTMGVMGISRGVRFDKLDWARPLTVWVRFSILAGTTNGIARITLGKANATGIGNLATRGIQFQVGNLTPTAGVHDGTSLAGVTLSTGVLVAATIYDLRLESDGRGNIGFYIDDVLRGSSAAGPSTVTPNADENNWQLEVSNGADSAAQALFVSDIQWQDG